MAKLPTLSKNPAGDQFSPKSSFISLVEYNKSDQSLTVSFKSGTRYKYLYVPDELWQDFQSANDQDLFYANSIKGKVTSVPIVRKTVGKPRPKSLQQPRSPHHVGVFNAGIRSAQRAAKRKAGTVPD